LPKAVTAGPQARREKLARSTDMMPVRKMPGAADRGDRRAELAQNEP
jgi:hypothetical protein